MATKQDTTGTESAKVMREPRAVALPFHESATAHARANRGGGDCAMWWLFGW